MSAYLQQILDNEALTGEEQQRFEQFCQRLPALRDGFLNAPMAAIRPLQTLPFDDAETARITQLAAQIRSRSKGLIVIGTGGSSLGGKTLCALAGDAFPVHFLENLDPHTMQLLLDDPDLPQLHLLMISKSGGTMETICQSVIVIEALQAKLGAAKLSQCCHALTMAEDRPLRALAEHYGIPVIEHHPNVGGRFSVLSNVGLLPAAIAGLDLAAIMQGAQSVLDALQTQDDAPPLLGAAWQAVLMSSRPISVIMPYCDRLALFGNWYRQLWAESLGKDGQGSTPVQALGAVDQHSQLQLYLDGPKDKSFTLLTLSHAEQGVRIAKPPIDDYDYLGGKTIGEVMQALQEGTSQTLERHHLPLRRMELESLNEKALGALLMHFMLETIFCAQLIGVNAFDQPAVEESKQLARAALMGGSPRAA